MLVCRDLQGASPSQDSKGSKWPACAWAASCQQFLGLQMAGSSSRLAQCSAEIMETDATKNCVETINCQTKPYSALFISFYLFSSRFISFHLVSSLNIFCFRPGADITCWAPNRTPDPKLINVNMVQVIGGFPKFVFYLFIY